MQRIELYHCTRIRGRAALVIVPWVRVAFYVIFYVTADSLRLGRTSGPFNVLSYSHCAKKSSELSLWYSIKNLPPLKGLVAVSVAGLTYLRLLQQTYELT